MQKGTVIAGRFELLATAAKGAMGMVYRARDSETGKVVAVKVLTLEGPLDITRFQREAALLATIQHPNIVDYVAHGESRGIHFLAADWVEGVTLAVHLRNHGATIAETVAVGTGVAAALAATHALGVVHRDIKPSNIILAGGSPDHVKLVDFGVARRTIEAGVVTKMGVMVGTPSYMAPEQALGLVTIEPAADVWALGCVLYEALTGRMAFGATTPLAIRAKVLIGNTVPIHDHCPEAPADLVALIEAMLVKDPVKRLPDGAAVLARLSALAPIAPDTQRRRVGNTESPTMILPHRKRPDAACFVFVSAPEPDSSSTDAAVSDRTEVCSIAARHAMDIHVFDDGSALLTASGSGKSAAVDAARAALELREQAGEGAVSVFGQAQHDSLDTAIDRGAEMLERATMGSLFSAPADPMVHIDDVIAELIADELPVVSTDQGPALRAPPARTKSA